ncbi:MAG: hypothetical protein QGH33_18430 [Pirellulaceae bacterium]|nr:hypothetical protein [Pirellulaceae bacterium]MDP7303552.1 hypothetical protein [Pirellulaceae bacterium]HJN09501.1 hypothetical protein [Pirellulaceae bacterium]
MPTRALSELRNGVSILPALSFASVNCKLEANATDANALTEWASARIPQTRKVDLVRTRGGQVIPAIRVGAKPAGAARSSESPPTTQPINGRPYTIWIQARQHAWEAGSSWVCKGLINWTEPRQTAGGNRSVLRSGAVACRGRLFLAKK